MRRFVKTSILALAAWGLLACVNPSAARAQYYYPAPVAQPVAPPVVSYYTPPVAYIPPGPVVTYYGPQYVAPVRYSFYAPVVVAAPPVIGGPSGTTTTSYYFYRGQPPQPPYSGVTTHTSPYANSTPVYGSAYYTPLYFRY